MLLEFKDIDTYYGDLHVLKRVNYTIGEGEIVSLLGGNASGKSTTMKTVMGVVRPTRGTLIYQGEAIERMPTAERVRRGIAPVLEARRLFPRMTVFENLEMGAYLRKRGVGIRSGPRARLFAVPAREGAAQPDRGHAVGWRAADGGDGARADGAAEAALHG